MKRIKTIITNLIDWLNSFCFHTGDVEVVEYRGIETVLKCKECGATFTRGLSDYYGL